MKRTVICLLLVFVAAYAMAGNLAFLENLGFSQDGRYFMFGQHVLMADVGQAYAELAVVDVRSNDFVPGGWKKGAWNVPMVPNQDSRGALFELYSQSVDLKNRYGVSPVQQGRLLYTRSNGDETMVEAPGGKAAVPTLSFRDFDWGREYDLALTQESKTEGTAVSSAFEIVVTVRGPNGGTATYNVGRKGYFRPGIESYSIARVWLGPNGRSLVIAVAKKSPDLSVRYMVETVILK